MSASQSNFQPIRLFLPDDASLNLLLAQASDSEKMIEVSFRLSSSPHRLWINFFVKAWRFWYGENVPQVMGSALIIRCRTAEIREARLMLIPIIDEVNRMSAPLIRAEAAGLQAGQERRAKMYELEQYHAQPVLITNDRDGDILRDALYNAQQQQTRELKAKIARAEIQKAIDEMITDDLLDATSRAEGAQNAASN